MLRMWALLTLLICCFPLPAQAGTAEPLFPFIKLEEPYGSVSDAANRIARTLSGAGYVSLGFADVNKGLRVMAFYKPQWLQAWANSSPVALFGAVVHVGVQQEGRHAVVSLANPLWRTHLYHMSPAIGQQLAADLAAHLGQGTPYGLKQGYPPERIADLRYFPLAYGVEDFTTIAQHPSHASAVAAVEAGLKKYHTLAKSLYKLHLPQRGTTLYGIAPIAKDDLITPLWQKHTLKPAAHLPYTLLVQPDGQVQMHHPQFALLAHYPNLSLRSMLSSLDDLYRPVTELLTKIAR
ncbi:hypothetical protein Mmc1_0951 [Magnetococcus marinus MC-1]|uniref:DUF302 domain-containing protein n=1 Tax=Magnetococcus marinus (strain ATCC BAA-1437 / JCM 17883 / MC-1) TaxID=156889 RepID=A0L676_MAGMM|nr:hypothetical protein [Magnetococcus marinus]ABK43469.1 hypothetical protein Mmc1_0951 [Magnetococcus marinus MC-1]